MFNSNSVRYADRSCLNFAEVNTRRFLEQKFDFMVYYTNMSQNMSIGYNIYDRGFQPAARRCVDTFVIIM